MCGLFGIISTENDSIKHAEILQELAIINILRGWDATGIAGIKILENKEKPEVSLYKRALCSFDYLQLRGFHKQILDQVSEFSVMIGHTRSKTNGAGKDNEAHPFYVKDIVMAHNGTLSGRGGMKTWDPKLIDSANIAENLADVEDFAKFLEQLAGSFALSIFNLKIYELMLARNLERPLSVAFEKNKNTMYWSSEPFMLRTVLERNQVTIDAPGVAKLKCNLLYTFPLYKVRSFTTKTFEDYRTPISYPSQSQWKRMMQEHGPKKGRQSSLKPEEIFKLLNVKKDEKIVMRFNEYSGPTEPKKRGSIYGFSKQGNRVVPAIIYNTDKTIYETVGHGGYGFVRVCGAFEHTKYGYVLIVAYIEPASQIRLPESMQTPEVLGEHAMGESRLSIIEKDELIWPKDPVFSPKAALPRGVCYGPAATISTERFAALTSDGCYMCGRNISIADDAELFWTQNTTVPAPICRNCMIDHLWETAEKEIDPKLIDTAGVK